MKPEAGGKMPHVVKYVFVSVNLGRSFQASTILRYTTTLLIISQDRSNAWAGISCRHPGHILQSDNVSHRGIRSVSDLKQPAAVAEQFSDADTMLCTEEGVTLQPGDNTFNIPLRVSLSVFVESGCCSSNLGS